VHARQTGVVLAAAGGAGWVDAAVTYTGRTTVNRRLLAPMTALAMACAGGGALLAGSVPARVYRRGSGFVRIVLLVVVLVLLVKPGHDQLA
jgi:uncharacterized membrane protein YfcA